MLFLLLPFLQSPRNSNRPYRDLMPCTSPRLTRVKKGITNLRAPSMPTPKEHLQRGKIPARLLRPPTPTIFLFLFRTLTFTSLPTVQHHSATVLTSHNTKTIQDSTDIVGEAKRCGCSLWQPCRTSTFQGLYLVAC